MKLQFATRVKAALLFLQTLGFRRPSYLISDCSAGPYSLISTSPPIFYLKHWMDESFRLQYCLDTLWEGLSNYRAYFFCSWRWWIEEPERIDVAKRFEDAHQRLYPEHRFIHLCNTLRQYELFQDRGFDAVFCNQNCLVDERIFRPLADIPKIFNAVYDARLKTYKRHYLAERIQNLALIYDFHPEIDEPSYVEKIRQHFNTAHFFNHDKSQTYQTLCAQQVNQCLNACRVGLCLSRREGAMYASMQYLLSGLSVVSTQSEGGRDVFFDDSCAIIVDDNPTAVQEGVAELIKRNIPAEDIRRGALNKIKSHRMRFVSRLQQIYDDAGVNRNFESEWNHIFFNKFFREKQSHKQILQLLTKYE